jgi:Glycosyltransferase family 87
MTSRARIGGGDLSAAQQARRRWLTRRRNPRLEHALRLVVFAVAIVGGICGLIELWIHITNDPIADAQAYYAAATRLNHGQALYPANADPTHNLIYLYPPLLAIALRPFALLPYYAFAITWEIFVVGCFLLTIRQLGGGFRTYVAIGILGIPIGWALGIGQAHVPLTLLLAIGQPWSIALAADIKLFPALVALWWIGKRDYESFIAFLGWSLIFGLVQLILEPTGTLAFLRGAIGLGQLGDVQNISPYVWASPIAWAAILLVGILVTVALARTKWGWAAAVVLATLSPPRLLLYMLTGLLAAIRRPRIAGEADPNRVPTAAESYVGSAR